MEGGLLAHLVTALGAALVGAALALRLRQPLILGYILAGVAIGPFTPGIIGDVDAIAALAEIGVIFLMFVIGVQLSLRELIRAGRIALIGGLLQVCAMIGIGYLVGRALGWGSVESYAFGAVISNSSSTVLGKIMSERGELDSNHAQLGLAWSSVQDISTVALVAVLAVLSPVQTSVGLLLGKAALFFFVLVPLSFWVLPKLLRKVTALGSREFFALAVITVALAMAGGAALLGVSLALGAFLTGIIVGETDLAHRILGDTIPLRDVFSGIFFVSIGMLLDPAVLVHAWPLVLLTVALIIVVKGTLTAVIARWLGCSTRIAVLLGAGLAQSAEFSFLLARLGLELGTLPMPIFNLLLSATVVTILLSPIVNEVSPRLLRWVQRRRSTPLDTDAVAVPSVEQHAIVCGYGRVGSIVCTLLEQQQRPFVVIEEDLRIVESLRARGVTALFGDAGLVEVLDRAQLRSARLLVLCIPERMAVRRALEHARAVSKAATVLARTHSLADRRILQQHGADEAVVGELELALELGRRALDRFGVETEAIEQSIEELRRTLT
ncbi:MAG TPA: cation:proton antiporter [Enhygromyxa sp.]|nr:cation:proton antiporter [Enhygromyxa sp.]